VKTSAVDEDKQTTIGGADIVVTGGDWVRSTGGNYAGIVGGDSVAVVTGTSQATIGEAASLDVGDKAKVEIGKGLDVTTGGDIGVKASGKVGINGSKIVLGPNGRHPLPVFDTYLRDHAEFMTHLVTAIGALVPSNPIALGTQLALMQKFIVLTTQGFPYESSKVGND
jgi:hypothetical protein